MITKFELSLTYVSHLTLKKKLSLLCQKLSNGLERFLAHFIYHIRSTMNLHSEKVSSET